MAHGFFILVGTAIFAATPWGTATLNNVGPHGFSEMLYEFSSSSANNGSGFEGLGDNTVPWNVATGIVMLLARFIPIILPLAIVGSLLTKRRAAESAGTLGVEDGTFAGMLLATILVVGALTFFPAATLGTDRRASDVHEIGGRRTDTWNPCSPASASSSPPCSFAWPDTPAVIWGIGQILTPDTAQGSLITAPDGKVIGSRLIAQKFTQAALFLAAALCGRLQRRRPPAAATNRRPAPT